MIADSSPFIVFGKLNKIGVLLKLFKNIEISEGVFIEAVSEGLEKKFEDSLILKSEVESGKIIVVKLENKYLELAKKLQSFNNLGIGESQTIALARQLKRQELMIDESLAREAAKSLGLNPIGSLRVLLLAYSKGLLDQKEIETIINNMIKLKFRIGSPVLIRFWELFNRLKK